MPKAVALLLNGSCHSGNHIETDEYEFIEISLQRWRDRDYRPIDRRSEADHNS